MDEELKKRIEAILFSIGSKINVNDIMRMTREKDKAKIVSCLIELKNKYATDDNNSLMILQDGDDWKLTIKDQYIEVAKELGVETELKKTVLETLAVIAYKTPCLQSEVIKIRTNKAYDHLLELEQLGYIERERSGRTKKIKLTPKFFDYFELPPESLREKFKNVTEMEKGISIKERQIHEITEMKREKIEEMKREDDEKIKENIFVSNPNNPNIIDVVSETKEGLGMIVDEKLGGLSVIDEESETETVSKEITKNSNEEARFNPSISIEDEEDMENKEIKIVSTDYSFNDNPAVKEALKNDTLDKTDNFETSSEEKLDTINTNTDNATDINKDDELEEQTITNLQNKKNEINNNKNNDYDNNDARHNKTETELEESNKTKENSENNNHYRKNIINTDNPEKKKHGESISESDKEDKMEHLESEDVRTSIQTETDDDIEKKEYEIPSVHLSEEKLFNMEDMPTEIMDRIEKRAEEITGEIKEKKSKKTDDFNFQK